MTQGVRRNRDERLERRTQQLMPYEAVAKAIFVRANGLIAYKTVTGTNKRSADEKPGHYHERPAATKEFHLAYVPSKRGPQNGSTQQGQIHALSKRITMSPATLVSANGVAATEMDADQLRKATQQGVGFDGRYYRYRSYHYDKLSDALDYAELESGRLGGQAFDPLSQWLEPYHPTDAERALMEMFGVTFDGKYYAYERYRYDRCIDAINYAKSHILG